MQMQNLDFDAFLSDFKFVSFCNLSESDFKERQNGFGFNFSVKTK